MQKVLGMNVVQFDKGWTKFEELTLGLSSADVGNMYSSLRRRLNSTSAVFLFRRCLVLPELAPERQPSSPKQIYDFIWYATKRSRTKILESLVHELAINSQNKSSCLDVIWDGLKGTLRRHTQGSTEFGLKTHSGSTRGNLAASSKARGMVPSGERQEISQIVDMAVKCKFNEEQEARPLTSE
eukprot:Gb_28470 [translate_table: standard]